MFILLDIVGALLLLFNLDDSIAWRLVVGFYTLRLTNY